MTRRLRNRLFAALALALVVGGATLAAVTAARDSGSRHHASATTLGIASAYLGMSEAQLRHDVRSGESLAKVAEGSGRSPQGLIETIVTARRSRLEAQLAQLKTHVTEQVMRRRAARLRPGAHAAARSPLAVAAGYLGLSPTQLHLQLRSGRTLAQIADGTPGHSRAGLLAALLARRRRRLDAKVAEGALTAAVAQRWLARLQARLGSRVDRVWGPGGSPGKARARR